MILIKTPDISWDVLLMLRTSLELSLTLSIAWVVHVYSILGLADHTVAANGRSVAESAASRSL